jgi:hypothetical protein
VDQADPMILAQMNYYVQELFTLPVAWGNLTCWFRAFVKLADNQTSFAELTFNEQILEFLSDSVMKGLYGEHILWNEKNGFVQESRCVADLHYMDSDSSDWGSVLKAITDSQPINRGRSQSELAFLTYANDCGMPLSSPAGT